MTFWHVTERSLNLGDAIPFGRWGTTVLQAGQSHPFYYREQLLEVWRRQHTIVPVSRLACTFVFDDLNTARAYRGNGDFVYEVRPANPDAEHVRLDMVWLTWLGEPNATPERVMNQCTGYWSGQTTADLNPVAQPAFEVLIGCNLTVVGKTTG